MQGMAAHRHTRHSLSVSHAVGYNAVGSLGQADSDLLISVCSQDILVISTQGLLAEGEL